MQKVYGCDGGGFFVVVVVLKILGEGSPALFFFFPSEDQLANTSSIFLGQDQSTVAQRAEKTVAKCASSFF